MNLKITQDNLYLIIPTKISRMAELLVEDTGCDVIEAVNAIYLSETYKRLADEKTKAWHLGPVDLYSDFRRENSHPFQQLQTIASK